LAPEERDIFDFAATVLWPFDPEKSSSNQHGVERDDLLFSFRDFVRRFIPNLGRGAPSQRHRDTSDREWNGMLDHHAPSGTAQTPIYRDGASGGGGEPPPLEFLDPPDTDSALDELDRSLDDLAALGAFLDGCPGPGGCDDSGADAFGSANSQGSDLPQQTSFAHLGLESASDLVVILLLASVAIGLALLTMIGIYNPGQPSDVPSTNLMLALRHDIGFEAIKHTLPSSTPLANTYALFKIFFFPSSLEAHCFPSEDPPSLPTQPSPQSAQLLNSVSNHVAQEVRSGLVPYLAEPQQLSSFSVPSSTPSGSSPGATETSHPVSTRSGSSSPASNECKLTCRHCQKRLGSTSARNRHMQTGCKKVYRPGFPCRVLAGVNERGEEVRGCGKRLSTSCNRDVHEKNSCPLRVRAGGRR
jgi:hypothetical protein